MKKWRCTVCGYIHEGNSPPETCPICGSPKEKFEPYGEYLKNNGVEKKIDSSEYVADVIVVGSGASAFSAAITARSKGASVIMVEKADIIGGTTARSGGGYWIPNNDLQKTRGYKDNKKDSLRYMARYSYPNLYNPNDKRLGLTEHQYELLEAFYDNGSKMVNYFDKIGALRSILELNWTGKAHVDYMDHLPENKGIRGRTLFSKKPDGKQGWGIDLINQMEKWAKEHDIRMITGCEVTSIIKGTDETIYGVIGKSKNGEINFFARQGVIFGSGGYSRNTKFMQQFQPGPNYGGCAVPTNTGDFIRMAGNIGASIGNTHSAFRADSMIEAFLANPDSSSNVFYIVGDSVIIVNKYGKRVVDEKRNYNDRAKIHFQWDPERAEWKNMLTFMIFDDRTATLWQGWPPLPRKDSQLPKHIIKANTLDDLTAGISEHLKVLSEKTGGFSLESVFSDNLKGTLEKFNEYADAGNDPDFHRGDYIYDREWTTFPPMIDNVEWPEKGTKNYTMHRFNKDGPYYAIILGAGTLDTNGGPIVNGRGCILDWNDKPIDGLFGAGNCIASPTVEAYWGGGSTIGPALTFGYIAGSNIVKRKKKSPEV
ncbi:MAG: FAD-dependent oxidoreductase [Candidatus Methanomethylophilaceae archaeon]